MSCRKGQLGIGAVSVGPGSLMSIYDSEQTLANQTIIELVANLELQTQTDAQLESELESQPGSNPGAHFHFKEF